MWQLGNSFEALGDFFINVNYPVTYLNCGNKGTTAHASVNLEDTPFYFSGDYNRFGSVGCGNWAIVYSTISNEPLAGSLQPRCDNPTSKSGACYAQIPEYLISYTATIREVINPEIGQLQHSDRCTSAFMFSQFMLNSSSPFLLHFNNISIDTMHVPVTLGWNYSVECDLGARRCRELQPTPVAAVPHKYVCTEKCGEIDILYPFGMKKGCYMNKSVIVNNSITYSNCRNKYAENNGVSVNLADTPFYFLDISNRLFSVGCGSFVTIFPNPIDYPLGGCQQPPCNYSNNHMTSNVSCNMIFPPVISSFAVNMTEIYPSNISRSCGSAFLADVSLSDSYWRKEENGISSWTKDPTTYLRPKFGHVPTALQWGTPKRGRCELKDGSNTLCSSDSQYCWSNISSKHLCVCGVKEVYIGGSHYSGNLYSTDVCQDKTDCWDAKYKYCYLLCLNAPGNYCNSSTCPDRFGYSSTEDLCKPIPESPTKMPKKSQNWLIITGCSTSFGTAFVLLCTWRTYKVLKRRKSIKLKQKYFKRNGGLLLQQQLSRKEGNVEKIMFFSSKELELLTGQKPISSTESEEARNLASYFLHSMKKNSLFDILDPMVSKDGPQEEITAVAKLAKRCLNLNGKKRPKMKQVAVELEWIRLSEEANIIEQRVNEDSDTDDEIEPSVIASCSTTRSIINDTITLSVDA
ncbi:hypothetical protein PTKIN_Ptkin09bG0247200 [Pterospermum kingtungense]